MAQSPVKWSLECDYLQACNCDYGCPCEFEAPPTMGYCEGVGAWRIDKGNYGDVKLDGLAFAFAARWPKAIHQGNGTVQLYFDERANPKQREALVQIASGQAGGLPFEIIVTTFNKVLEPKFAPFKFEMKGKNSSVRIGDNFSAVMEPIKNPVTGEPESVAVEHATGFIFTWELLLLFVMWSIMMIAMMAPTAVPMTLTFAAVNRRRRAAQKPYVPTGFFLLGYLLAWTFFSAVATAAQWALHGAALLSPTMVSTSAALGASILIIAGMFQFTPLKHACLSHCRDPLSFMMTQWRDGTGGALLMGLRHGVFCLGCCWILMLLLFVTGVMNLLWVGIITTFVLLEKIAPAPKWTSRAAGVAMIAWGAWMLVMRYR